MTFIYEKAGDKDYSCFVEEDTGKCGLAGYGSSAMEAERDLYITRDEYLKEGENVPEIEVSKRTFDIGSFFDYYPINITQFAKFAGINASLLRQYVSNKRNPSNKRKSQIMDKIKELGKVFMNESCAIGID